MNSQPRVLAVLVAAFEQQLEPQADSQKRLARVDRLEDGVGQPQPVQLADGVLHGPHARQDDLGGLLDLVAVSRDDSLVPNVLETLLHAAKVTHSIVDNRDHWRSKLSAGGGEEKIWVGGQKKSTS